METDPAKGRVFLKEHLDLVALATIADVVPLTGENRILARAGMEAMRVTERVGLRALMDVAGVNGSVSTRTIGFQIAPRLNAAGRARSAMIGARLLLCDDPEEARTIAEDLNALNVQRQIDEKAMLVEALAECERLTEEQRRKVIVVAREGWASGLVGLIASRLTERFCRPSFVIGLDRASGRAKGSARGIPGFNLFEALKACESVLDECGGHAMAAGLRLKVDGVDAFRDAMIAHAERVLPDDRLRPEILIDAEAPLASLTLDATDALDALEPFGEGNPRPLISMSGVSLAEAPRVVGKNHLKLRLRQNGATVSAIGWNMGGLDSRLLRHQGAISVAGHPKTSEYRERRYAEIEVCDVRFD
jgi:single-stranded-DNA-specific exonuclease